MANDKLTDPQWRMFIVQRLDEGDRRFGLLEEGQKKMDGKIEENTTLTKHAVDIAQHTERKVDKLILDTHNIADQRHRENLERMDLAARNAEEAKQSALKTQEDVAGLVSIYDGGKTGIKIVKGLAIGIKGIVIYGAGIVLGVSVITATILYWFGKVPALPPLFGH